MDRPGKLKHRIVNLTSGLVVLTGSAFGLSALIESAPRADRRSPESQALSVKVTPVEAQTFQAPVIGYGTVRPKRQVSIIPEVSGQLTASHPRLATGNVIRKGELIFAIDARMHESRVAQATAEISRLQAQLQRHEQTGEDLVGQLQIAREQAALAHKGVIRERELFEESSSTALELEAALIRSYQHQEAVLAYESQLGMIPSLIDETQALLDIKRAQLAEAQLSVEKARIYSPFHARVDQVSAHHPQVVVTGTPIAVLTDIDALEVPVAVDPSELRWLDKDLLLRDDWDAAAEAIVTWTTRGQEQAWRGRVMRLERLDPVTRSAHIVVEVRNDPGSPLPARSTGPSVGMFCRVEIPTTSLTGAVVVPRSAIHENHTVYVFEPDGPTGKTGRLRITPVPLLRRVADAVVVTFDGHPTHDGTALRPGDLLITSPLPNAVDRLPLTVRPPVHDNSAPSGDP